MLLFKSIFLISEFVAGTAVDQIASSLTQPQRQSIALRLMFVMIKELFEWRFIQTDPNWSMYLLHLRIETTPEPFQSTTLPSSKYPRTLFKVTNKLYISLFNLHKTFTFIR